jgi:hypothetical protein
MMPANYLQAGVGLTPGGVVLDLRGEIATMPNGQKYEDWLKDKKAQGKDEKNE